MIPEEFSIFLVQYMNFGIKKKNGLKILLYKEWSKTFRFNQDYYSKTYNQNDFLLYFIFQKILIYFDLVSAVHKYCIKLQWYVCTVYQ